MEVSPSWPSFKKLSPQQKLDLKIEFLQALQRAMVPAATLSVDHRVKTNQPHAKQHFPSFSSVGMPLNIEMPPVSTQQPSIQIASHTPAATYYSSFTLSPDPLCGTSSTSSSFCTEQSILPHSDSEVLELH
jgi:hypothetical protein